jgi:hypothetical protein
VRATRRTSLVATTRNPDSVRQMVSLVELTRKIESGEPPPDCHQTSALLPNHTSPTSYRVEDHPIWHVDLYATWLPHSTDSLPESANSIHTPTGSSFAAPH